MNENEADTDLEPRLKERIVRQLAQQPWHRYPDPTMGALRRALATYSGHPVEGILPTAGANQALLHVIFALHTDTLLIRCPPHYHLYERLGTLAGLRQREIPLRRHNGFTWDLDALIAAAGTAERTAIILTSPNNPTGDVLAQDAIERLLAQTRSTLIVDEVYGEFASPLSSETLLDNPRVLSIRSLSKAFGAAGVRVGYLLAHPTWLEALEKTVSPYALSSFSQTVATCLLEDPTRVRTRCARLVAERERIRAAIDAIDGLEPLPSSANFFLVSIGERLGGPTAAVGALAQSGLLVRDCSAMEGIGDCLRITVSTPEANDRLIAALQVYGSSFGP